MQDRTGPEAELTWIKWGRALLPHDHLDVHIYESAPEFSERGMGIIMAVNAQRALEHIVGGEEEVEGMFKRAGAVVMNSSRIMMVRPPLDLLSIASCLPSLNRCVEDCDIREEWSDEETTRCLCVVTGRRTARRHKDPRHRAGKTEQDDGARGSAERVTRAHT
jgi:hypothetical protein